MGPNGAGKSTLANVVMGHPGYVVTEGDDPASAARTSPPGPPTSGRGRGLPGLPVPRGHLGRLGRAVPAPGHRRAQGLDESERARGATGPDGVDGPTRAWTPPSPSATSTRGSPAVSASATRSCRWPCSPRRRVARRDRLGTRHRRAAHRRRAACAPCASEHPEMGVLVVTHYVKLLEEIEPDQVHVLVDGRIVDLGGRLAGPEIEERGYDALRPVARDPLRPPRVRADIPLLTRVINGRPDHLPRLGRLVAAPRAVIEAMTATTSSPRQRAPRRLPDRQRGHRRLRGRPARSRASSTPRRRRRDRLHQERHRVLQPARQSWGAPTCRPATWCWSARWSTTPTSCRGSNCARSRGRGPLHPGRRRLPTGPRANSTK